MTMQPSHAMLTVRLSSVMFELTTIPSNLSCFAATIDYTIKKGIEAWTPMTMKLTAACDHALLLISIWSVCHCPWQYTHCNLLYFLLFCIQIDFKRKWYVIIVFQLFVSLLLLKGPLTCIHSATFVPDTTSLWNKIEWNLGTAASEDWRTTDHC